MNADAVPAGIERRAPLPPLRLFDATLSERRFLSAGMVRVTVRGDALREHRVALTEVHHDMHRVELVDPMPDVRVQWIRSVGSGHALVRALRATELPGGLPYVGAGCETAELKVIRRYLRAARDIPRSHTELVGYWRRGQPSD